MHLEHVGVRVDVDDLAEARMRRRAVVALEEVLQDDLPVRLDRPLVMGVEADRADVEPAPATISGSSLHLEWSLPETT